MVARASREPQQPPPTRVSGEKGGLQDHLAEWVAAGATPWVLKTIKEGLQLRWKRKPPQQLQMVITEGRCPPELEMTMNEQAQKGLWREVQPGDEVKMISKAFAILKGKGEGFRLLVDHSRLSKYLLAPHFKMGSIRDALALLVRHAFMAKIDLTNAYAQVPLSREAAGYLVASTGRKLWWPLGMPQGTSCAPFAFTCVIKTVWRALRKKGINTIGYLDDCLLVMPRMSFQEAQAQLNTARKLFTDLGFQINMKKSSSAPTKKLTFLGMELNTEDWTIKWPDAKRQGVQQEMKKLLKGAQTPRTLARVVGALKAAGPAWPTIHLETFTLQKELSRAARSGWDKKMTLTNEIYKEIRRIYKLLNQPKVAPISRGRIQATLTTDAAPSHGWGATLKIAQKEWRYAEQWPMSQLGRHSTELEIRAVANAMMHFEPLIRDTQLVVRSDCSAVVWDLTRKRAGTKTMQTIVLQIIKLTEKLNIELTSTHLAGVLNTISDKLSRTELHSGLVLRAEAFSQLQRHLGPCTVDAFATRANAKLPRFFTWLPDPEAEAQDFFAQHLDKKELYYVFPPIALLLRALAKIRDEQVRAVVVAPSFPDQVWAPLLRSGTLKSIDLGTEALVPNQAFRELPKNTRMIAYLWETQAHLQEQH